MTILPPLAVRLSNALQDFIARPIAGDTYTETARQAVDDLVFRRRVENTAITPETEAAKSLRLMASIEDTARAVRHTNIRILRVLLGVRGNSKAATGKADPFNAACAALETLLDHSNLAVALTSAARGIKVFLATRQPGIRYACDADIREDALMLEVRAIGLEHTNAVQLEDGTFRTTEAGELVTTEG